MQLNKGSRRHLPFLEDQYKAWTTYTPPLNLSCKTKPDIIEKPCTSYHIGRIPHTIINQSLKIFIKIVFFFTISNNKDLLIFSVLLCSLYCKRQMSPLAIFPRRTWPTLLQGQHFLSWYKRIQYYLSFHAVHKRQNIAEGMERDLRSSSNHLASKVDFGSMHKLNIHYSVKSPNRHWNLRTCYNVQDNSGLI